MQPTIITDKFELYNADCFKVMADLPSNYVDLVVADPPYNIGVVTAGKRNEWDKIDNYIQWSADWLEECHRILKPNGVLYMWHNDILQISDILQQIKVREIPLALQSFCIWDKGDTYRPISWKNRDPMSETSLRSWFNVCEFCLHFFNMPDKGAGNDALWGKTGLERINSDPESYKSIKEWYKSELQRLGITEDDILLKYQQETGKSGAMLRHYFHDSQFEIPVQEVWDAVYKPLGFRREYEDLRREYEDLRNFHRCDENHKNVWSVPPLPSNNRLHTCEKPVPILERLLQVSSPAGGVILDPFMGSGSTGIAAMNTGRRFIGIEKDRRYFSGASERLFQHMQE